MLKIAILGYGNIGSGVAQVLTKSKETVTKRAKDEIEIAAILDLRSFPEDPFGHLIVDDINTILENPEIAIVVETMGGTKPAYEYVKACLLAGKHVATSNKELVANHGAELLKIAREKQINFLFEASVGGGIPIIRPLNQCITGDDVQGINGILNGTTNYMLTMMDQHGDSYADALKNAQDLGYAERNPEADVEGYDSCRKIAILSSLAFGKQVCYQDIKTEGITKISTTDMQYAKAMGCSIKLLGTSRLKAGKVYASVAPALVSSAHPLYNVNDVMNGILVSGEVIGDLMFYGAGAGKLPTAGAVVADIIDAANNLDRNCMPGWSEETLSLGEQADVEERYFVRVKDMTIQQVQEILPVEKTIQLPDMEEFAVLTKVIKHADFNEKKQQLAGVLSVIRLAD